jgi:hypothetical protein
MLTLKRHRLVGADFQSAFDWYENQHSGLGLEFAEDFRHSYHRLREGPLLYSIRFASSRAGWHVAKRLECAVFPRFGRACR